MLLDDGFDRRAVTWFERTFGAALLVESATQVTGGVWKVHAGAFYPWRHIGLVPLAPPALLAVEWLAVVSCATLLVFGRARAVAWRVLAPALLWGVLQRFSNHGALFFMIAFFVSMSPPEPASPDFEERAHPNLGLVRAQLVIVYVASALAKLLHGFTSGESLVNLTGMPAGVARAAAWAVIAGEIALAALVVKKPRAGAVAIAIAHAGFAAVIPNVLSFGVCMVAMAVLWVRAGGASTSRAVPRSG